MALAGPSTGELVAALRASDATSEGRAKSMADIAGLLDSASDGAAALLCDSLRRDGLVQELLGFVSTPSATTLHPMALLILGNLCSEAVDPDAARTKALVKENHGFEMLLPHVFSTDDVTLIYALGVIQNLCREPSYLPVMQRLETVARLQELVRSNNEHIARFATGSLSNLHALVLERLSGPRVASAEPEYTVSIESLQQVATAASAGGGVAAQKAAQAAEGLLEQAYAAQEAEAVRELAVLEAWNKESAERHLRAAELIKAVLCFRVAKRKKREAGQRETAAAAAEAATAAGETRKTAPSGSPQGKAPAAAGASLGKVEEVEEMRIEEFAAVLIQARVRGAKVRCEFNVDDDELIALIAEVEAQEAEEARVLAAAAAAAVEAVAVAEVAEAEQARAAAAAVAEDAISELARELAGGKDAAVEDAARLAAEKATTEAATEPAAVAQGSAQATAKGAKAATEVAVAAAVAVAEKVVAEVSSAMASAGTAAGNAAAEAAAAEEAAETGAARESADASEASSEKRVAESAAAAETAAAEGAEADTDAAGQAAAAVSEQALEEASQALDEASHAWGEAALASAQSAGAAALAKSFVSLRAIFGEETAKKIAAFLSQNPPDRWSALCAATEAAAAMAAVEAEATLRAEAEEQDAVATAAEAVASKAKATWVRISSRMSRTSSDDVFFPSDFVAAPPSTEQGTEPSHGVFLTSVAALPSAGEELSEEESRSAARLQAVARGRAQRLGLQRAELHRRASATRVWSSVRGHLARVVVRKEKQAREAAAVRVQAAVRGHLSRHDSDPGAPLVAPDDEGAMLSRMRWRTYARRRAAEASAIQRAWRGARERGEAASTLRHAEQRRLAEERAEAAARIAAGFRGRRGRARAKRVRTERGLSALPPLAPLRLASSASLPAISPTRHAHGRRLSPPAGRPSPPRPLAPDLTPADLLRMALQAHAGRVCGLFSAWDEDGDGEISGAEFRKAVPTLLRAWGLPKLAGALGLIDDVFRGLDFHCTGHISIADLHRRLLALKPDAELQTEVKQTFTLRTQAPRVVLAEELRQPMRNAPPGAALERERTEVNLAKLRTQARGHDAGMDAQVRSASAPRLKTRVANSIKTAYAAEVRAGGGHATGMSAAEYTLHKAKVDAWASKPRKSGTLDPRVDPLARFFHVPDPAKMAEAAAKRLPSFRPVR